PAFWPSNPVLTGLSAPLRRTRPGRGATVLNALEAACDPLNSTPTSPGEPSRRAKQRAQGLQRIC
ncbi:MAG: hypothetical protein M3O70_11635, partial [Actinomycetota bacterium]|nr:hypothetical protein [Actinomycetota bacterium]